MNRINDDIALALGPCPDHEFDLVELSERALASERVPVVREHMAQCPRCRAFFAELAALDDALAETLPRPTVSPDFDARLADRIAALRRTPDRAAALAAAERDHARLLAQLGRALDWPSVLNALALGTVTGGALLALDSIAPGVLQATGLVPAGISASTTYALLLAVAFVAGGLAFARRIVGGPLLRAGG